MGYSNYKNLKMTLKRLGLEEIDMNIFPTIEPVPLSNWLLETIKIAKRMPLTNKKR